MTVKLIGSSADDDNQYWTGNYFILQKFTCLQTGVMTEFKIKSTGSGNVKAAIYADNAGEPGSLLNAVNDSTPISAGWNTIAFPSTNLTQGTDYWLAWNCDGNHTRYKSGSGVLGRYKSATYSSFTFPNPAGSGWTNSNSADSFQAGWGTTGQIHQASATLSGTGSLAGIGGVTRKGAATLSGTGTLAAAGGVTRRGSATLSGTGSLAASGAVYKMAAATLPGAGTLAATPRLILAASATLSGEGALSAKAVLTIVATATLSGTGGLSAAGTVLIGYVYASASLSGTGALKVSATAYFLSPTLVAAQKKARRTPYVEAKVYDYQQGIKRLTWTRLYTGSEPDNHHGLACDGQGSMHRIRALTGNKLLYQKITNPGPSSDYSSWTQIAADCDGPCAIAASGAKIYIFYRKTDDTLRKYYSHDYGQNWTNAELVAYTGALSLAAAWWGSGDIVVCFALRSNQLNGITLDTSDQTATQHTWSDGNHPLDNTYGIGATYNTALQQCEIVLAAKESDEPYSHHDLFRTKLSNTCNFLSLESFLMAPDGEDITYEYPDCHLPADAESYETNRITAVEKFTGTTAYTRPITCHMVKGTYWSDTTFTEPRPLLDPSPSEGPAYGLRMATTADYWWMETPSGIWRAPRPAAQPLDLTPHILSLTQRVSSPSMGEGQGEGALTIVLDNSTGYFASPGQGALASLRFRAEIQLRLGYKTTNGNEAVPAGTYWIDSWQYSTSLSPGGRGLGEGASLFTLHCLDAWGLMDRWTARYQMRWNKDDVNPRSVWQILYQVLARAGIRLSNTPAKPQSSAINNFYPDFALAPGTQGDAAIRRLLSFIPDRLVMRGQEAFTKDLLANETSCYSYGGGATDHPILAGQYSHQVTPSRSRALGQEEDGDRVLEEALDWDLLDLAIDEPEQVYDPNLTSSIRAQERADALLRDASLAAQRGNLVVPTSCGQALLDVVEVTDARCGIDQETYRVLAIRTDYDRRKAQYDQTLALGAP